MIINELIHLQESTGKDKDTVDAEVRFPDEEILMPRGHNEDRKEVKSIN